MTDELNRLMDEAAHTGAPASRLDTDALLHKGRRVARRHRNLLVTGVVAVVLAVTAPAVLVATAGADWFGGTTGAAGDPDSYPLPHVQADPSHRYEWEPWGYSESWPDPSTQTDPRPTAETAGYDEALWTYIRNDYPEDIKILEGLDGDWVEPSDDPAVHTVRMESELNDYAEEDSKPLRLSTEPIPHYVFDHAISETTAEEEFFVDDLKLTVYPAGSYRPGDPGNEDPTYLYTCSDRIPDWGLADYRDCEFSTGPDGESIVTINAYRYADDPEFPTTTSYTRTTVLYRNDGTAIKVQDSVVPPQDEPRMSEDEQIELLLSMPDTPVH